MKKNLLLLLSCGLFTGALAQTGAQFTSWMHNTDGHQAYYEKNSTPGPGTEIVNMSDSSDITSLYYTTNDIYVNCEGLGSYQMGEWSIPNVPVAKNYTFSIPRNPSENTGTKDVVPEGGAIAVAINGVPYYGYESAESWDGSGMSFTGDGIWNADAWVSEGTTMDDMGGGHATDNGSYHYHATPFALYSTTNTGHSPIIGWAPDGYPIYGPFGYSTALNASSSVVRMETSYQKRSITQRHSLPDGTMLPPGDWGPDVDGTYPVGYFVEDYEYNNGLGDLDEYNGRTCVTPEYPGGTYAYFITVDGSNEPEFPYLLAAEYYGNATTAGIGNATIPGGATKYSVVNGVTNIDPSSISVYPNPASTTIQITADANIESVVITNLLGITVLTSSEKSIDISGLGSGAYNVIINLGGSIVTKKLIVE